MTTSAPFPDGSCSLRFGSRPALRARERKLTERLARCESDIGAAGRQGPQMLSLGRERDSVHARLAQLRGELGRPAPRG
jgi:hypothetical protein